MMTTVALLFGGRSSEHTISCATAAGVLAALDRGFGSLEVLPVHPAPGRAAIRVLVPSALPALPLDRARLRLLLRNLLDNSLRHSEPGVPPPELHLRWQNEAVEIVVRDHGPGVPPEHLAQLAQAFYRPDSARQRTTGGVGLGLYLCRLVAQAHGGQLALRNAGPGLVVRVVLR